MSFGRDIAAGVVDGIFWKLFVFGMGCLLFGVAIGIWIIKHIN